MLASHNLVGASITQCYLCGQPGQPIFLFSFTNYTLIVLLLVNIQQT